MTSEVTLMFVIGGISYGYINTFKTSFMKTIKPNRRNYSAELKPLIRFIPLVFGLIAIGVQVNFQTTSCNYYSSMECVHNVGLLADRENLVTIALGLGVISALMLRQVD